MLQSREICCLEITLELVWIAGVLPPGLGPSTCSEQQALECLAGELAVGEVSVPKQYFLHLAFPIYPLSS